jgi:hypothetical protein
VRAARARALLGVSTFGIRHISSFNKGTSTVPVNLI